jgi:hypothetical protein
VSIVILAATSAGLGAWAAHPPVPMTFHQITAQADASTTLDGWRRYKFGMTVERARRALGASWDRDVGVPPTISMHSRPVLTEFGPDSRLALDFNGDQKLFEILIQSTDSQSADNCEKAFLKMLTALDAKYGAFSPSGTKDEWDVPGDISNGQRLLMRTVALQLSDKRTRYWYRTFPANLSGLNIEAEAKRSFGSRWIEVKMYQKNGSAGCHRRVQFSADIPTKAQLETSLKLKHIPADIDWHWAMVDRWLKGPSRYSIGSAKNVKLTRVRFSADLMPSPGDSPNIILHLAGTVSNNKIIAHVVSSKADPDGYPESFQGWPATFTVAGEPVDTYEIKLEGEGPWASASIALAGYHRNSTDKPTPAACDKIAELAFRTRGSVRSPTYMGLLEALGCKPV